MKWFIVLLGLSIDIVVAWISNLYQIASPILLEHKKKERTRKSFIRETNNSRRLLEPKNKGILNIIPREETKKITEQINLGRPVLLTGEAGTGKSGIAVALISEAKQRNHFPLLIDARRLIPYGNAAELKEHFDIEEPLIEGIERLGGDIGIWVIVDQLDNIAGSRGCNLIIDTLIECSGIPGVSVVVISRHNKGIEEEALRPLLESDFTEVSCKQLPREQVQAILREVGVSHPSEVLLEDLSINLLNLDLICEIARLSGANAVNNLENDPDLWGKYIDTLRERENLSGGNQGDKLLEEAIELASVGLSNQDRSFMLNYSLTRNQRRLVSNGVIIQVFGSDLRYQFRHERLQDYLYARHACNLNYGIDDVYDDIDSLHVRNIIVWMADIYELRKSPMHPQFIEELLHG